MSTAPLAEQVRTLRDAAGVVRDTRDVVLAAGDAVVDYLQGQVSQDVADLAVGASAWSFVLQPQGKVDVWFRITRTADAAFVLDADPGWGAALVARLERFKLRTAATFEPTTWTRLAVRGTVAAVPATPDDGIVVAVDRPGERGWDVLAPVAPAIPAGLVECAPAALEVLRIESGTPRMGSEIDESTIPAEAGVVPQSVSFTKGCYTGQELVARIDSRGSATPRRLVGVRVPNGVGLPEVGAAVVLGDAEVGRVTSVGGAGAHGGPVALAYLARSVATPVTAALAHDGDPVVVDVVDLPLVAS